MITLRESAEAAAVAQESKEGVGGVGMAYDRRVLKVPCNYLERQRSENGELHAKAAAARQGFDNAEAN